ncbi:MAG: hypothetical protein KZQ64_11750 [gamma proteobacterium symbiont of Bathyaustriella thionipta]|nr:hypothetical protein [gamma proteobacterium symbiont of Bathyaustriella thionipta]MCU7949443.1 hypothetical protein [gamma proteobacterium symbiont of Bathyaustriella thionipta]MCU7954045.1 hypothetical protein [gamma proteobacterium symbiont of Bathyaustriella thionipta]MCU7956030.1 hypothetical protein [gamma proteobacterium symbiont of Bathyaustriella thionipta]MCU7966222.1 hypothetical protein [gamma proteobacterium symbiont of Bathyaustriella thionipta]
MLNQFQLLFNISRSNLIARRYFVVNGFDGALTMLGLLMGFYVNNGDVSLHMVITACMGAAIALSVSGISSAYLSESAEKKQELQELESAMLADLQDSAYGQAARFMPFIIAVVNGLAPLIFALIIMSPLALAQWQPELITYPIETSVVVAFILIFFLGVFTGNISNSFWLWAGVRSLLIALITSIIIYLVSLI